jgi:hypothetical protein
LNPGLARTVPRTPAAHTCAPPCRAQRARVTEETAGEEAGIKSATLTIEFRVRVRLRVRVRVI